MKLLIEEYQYDVADVVDVLDGLFTLQDVEQKVSVKYVGYYYNPHEQVRDIVFILPKVLLNEDDKIFGKYEPKDLIHFDNAKVEEKHRKFLYDFSVWIHRAIVVYNESHSKNEIVLHRQIESEGKGMQKKKSNTLLDVILSLIHFNKENQQFFTFILKNIHSGFNKINWSRTISCSNAVVQNEEPIYINPINKKRQINFDEELFVIFFSILQYISDKFGYRVNINFGFKLLTGAKFERYLNGFGRTRLRQIKYKYFSDTAVKLWNLCYAFFDKTHKIRVNASQSEYLLVKSFHIVFEAMIDELIGTPHNELPKGLADQKDGKIVDHLYTYDGLLINNKVDDDIYYIGDSKYYKIGNSLGEESIYKQRTYARNVINWNIDLWLNEKANVNDDLESIQLFDPVTEGYKVIPNFFISAAIDNETLSYEDKTEPHPHQYPISRHFKNRLYDRDTLLLSHYNVNFLYVLSLYARNNSSAKSAWRLSVRDKFRTAVQEMLKEKFHFYALSAHPDVNAAEYFKAHFQETLGKTFRPFDNDDIYSLALDKDYPEQNKQLLATLEENFFVVECPLGDNPTQLISVEQNRKGEVQSSAGMGKFLFGVVNKFAEEKDKDKPTSEYISFQNYKAKKFVMRNMPGGDISKVSYFVPMFDGGIIGYYEIEGISFGTRLQDVTDKDGNTARISMPCLNIKLGEYHSLGDYIAEVPNFRFWNGQIHTYAEVMKLYGK